MYGRGLRGWHGNSLHCLFLESFRQRNSAIAAPPALHSTPCDKSRVKLQNFADVFFGDIQHSSKKQDATCLEDTVSFNPITGALVALYEVDPHKAQAALRYASSVHSAQVNPPHRSRQAAWVDAKILLQGLGLRVRL